MHNYVSQIIDSKQTAVFAISKQNFMWNPNDILYLIDTYPDMLETLTTATDTANHLLLLLALTGPRRWLQYPNDTFYLIDNYLDVTRSL